MIDDGLYHRFLFLIISLGNLFLFCLYVQDAGATAKG